MSIKYFVIDVEYADSDHGGCAWETVIVLSTDEAAAIRRAKYLYKGISFALCRTVEKTDLVK